MSEDKAVPEVSSITAHNCSNCDSGVSSVYAFCPNCGQQRKNPQEFKAFLGDFMKDYFTFDSKIFRSLRPLLFQPGFLVNEYIAGRRARYIPPLRIFLFSSILFFLFFGAGIENSTEALGRELDYFFDEILPKLVLLFLPLFALIVQLFFGRKAGYLKHFLFSTYLHSFVFILGVFYWCLSKLLQLSGALTLNSFLLSLCIAWVLLYLWFGLRRVYSKKSFGKQLVRFIGVLFTYGALLVVAAIVSVAILLRISN